MFNFPMITMVRRVEVGGMGFCVGERMYCCVGVAGSGMCCVDVGEYLSRSEREETWGVVVCVWMLDTMGWESVR